MDHHRKHIGILMLFALISAGAVSPASQAADGEPVHHLCLIYHGNNKRVNWTVEELLPYVAYCDAQRRPIDWFFDSFLMMEYANDEGAWFHHYRQDHKQVTANDWQWLAEAWFRPDTGLIGLERAVQRAAEVLHDPDHTVGVVIAMPKPLPPIKAFGPLPGQSAVLDFSSEPDRRAALEWYIERVLAEWREQSYKHLRLVGCYWTDEAVGGEDEALVRWTADKLHGRDLRFYWIPYFNALGLARWKEFGFDGAMHQPNYFFHLELPPQRFAAATELARKSGMGMEVEFDLRAVDDPRFRQRFWEYFNAAVKYGWSEMGPVGYYEGGGALRQFYTKPELREYYDAVYHFVTGNYQPRAIR